MSLTPFDDRSHHIVRYSRARSVDELSGSSPELPIEDSEYVSFVKTDMGLCTGESLRTNVGACVALTIPPSAVLRKH